VSQHKGLIIDVHGHYTSAPPGLFQYRAAQFAELNRPRRRPLRISDDEVRATLAAPLKAMDDRGISIVLISPIASRQGHDLGSERVSRYWTEVNNDLIHQVCRLFPDRFMAVCQLPQSPGVSPSHCVEELQRCVEDLGFVGCMINPDISGGLEPLTPSLGDEWWYPLWEEMVRLDVAGLIHASSTQNPAFHLNASHYIAQHYAATVELCDCEVYTAFPDLRLVLPHGGGAIAYQFNRHRALHLGGFMKTKSTFEEAVSKLFFDTAVYDAESLAMLVDRVGSERVLFGSEMFGTAHAVDPSTGRQFDDIVPMFRQMNGVSDADCEAIFWKNALTVYPRVAAAVHGSGLKPE
jgi:4-oxalmesaconate hydratase